MEDHVHRPGAFQHRCGAVLSPSKAEREDGVAIGREGPASDVGGPLQTPSTSESYSSTAIQST
jgi:hypothetical protein